MKLVFLPVNRCWAFMFGDTLTTMNGRMLFNDRDAAVEEAFMCGLKVKSDGTVVDHEVEV